jgi:hypothetical protein
VIDGEGEPERYAFKVEGALVSGTLDDYAQACKWAHYGDLSVSATVLTWSGTHHKVSTKRSSDDGDMIRYEISANGERAWYSIDGRA